MKGSENIFPDDNEEQSLALPVSDEEKVSEIALRKLLWQRDQSISYIYHKFSICGFESLSEVQTILKSENPELYEEFDKIIEELQSINAIKVVGDRVFCSSLDKFIDYKNNPLLLKAFLGEYIKLLVNRVLKNIVKMKDSQSLNSMHWFTLPGDSETMKALKAARIKYQAEVQSIAERANQERRRSSQTVVSFFGVSTPHAEDF